MFVSSSYIGINGLVEFEGEGIDLAILGGGREIDLVLGEIGLGGGISDINGQVDNVGSLGPEN